MLLRMVDVCAGYDRMQILHGIGLEVEEGRMVAIVGPNGSGKTTALKALIGLLRPTRGNVVFGGEEITGRRTDQLVRMGIGFVPQGRIVFPRMTVKENLGLGAFFEKDKRRVHAAMEWALDFFPELRERLRQRAGNLSGGEQQMVAIARALMGRPRLLLMDEPSLGLSPRYVGLVFERISALRREGLSILMVEQNATRALRLADHGYVFDMGRVAFEGPGPALLENPKVRELYVGGH